MLYYNIHYYAIPGARLVNAALSIVYNQAVNWRSPTYASALCTGCDPLISYTIYVHYTIPYYTILYYTILYYTVLCYTVLYYTTPYNTM